MIYFFIKIMFLCRKRIFQIWVSRGGAGDAGDAPKGTFEKVPSGLPQNFWVMGIGDWLFMDSGFMIGNRL